MGIFKLKTKMGSISLDKKWHPLKAERNMMALSMPQSGFSAIARMESYAESQFFMQVAANVCSMEKFLAAVQLGNGPFALLTTATQLRTILSEPLLWGGIPG